MNALRALLSRCGSTQLSDEEAIEAVAELLARGHLHVHSGPVSAVSTHASTVSESPKLVAFPLAKRKPRTQAVDSYVSPSDPPTFSFPVNVGAQTAALVAAAAGGTPFCPT
jgi:hypothetical protein